MHKFRWLFYIPDTYLRLLHMRASPKVMPPMLLCWYTMSEADVGGTVVEVERSHQHSTAFCCCVIDGSRGAVWQNGIWHGSAYEAKMCHWIPLCRRNVHSLTFINIYRCEHSEAVGGVFQQRQQRHERQATFKMAKHSCHTTKWKSVSISSSMQMVVTRLKNSIL